ncbi:MAG: hypothetical protein AVDCRST_MAG32-272, partial [uncultured Nocardioides sp.]
DQSVPGRGPSADARRRPRRGGRRGPGPRLAGAPDAHGRRPDRGQPPDALQDLRRQARALPGPRPAARAPAPRAGRRGDGGVRHAARTVGRRGAHHPRRRGGRPLGQGRAPQRRQRRVPAADHQPWRAGARPRASRADRPRAAPPPRPGPRPRRDRGRRRHADDPEPSRPASAARGEDGHGHRRDRHPVPRADRGRPTARPGRRRGAPTRGGGAV